METDNGGDYSSFTVNAKSLFGVSWWQVSWLVSRGGEYTRHQSRAITIGDKGQFRIGSIYNHYRSIRDGYSRG